MSKMLIKNTLRDVKKTKARFISIMLIIMLGVGFLVGINSTAPSMYKVAEEYYDSQNLMDFRLLSTVGFDKEDVKAIKETEGVESVMPSYFSDLFITGDTGSAVRVYSIPEEYEGTEKINKLTLKTGRMPERPDEILVGENKFGEETVGTVISFASPEETKELSDILKYNEFTVVGVVNSPMFISFERGSTNVGSGKISDFMFIPAESFAFERYTEVYVTASNLRGLKPYSDEYAALRNKFQNKLEDTGTLRVELFKEENIDTAQASLDEAKLSFEQEKSKAEKEIADAQNTIDTARNKLLEEMFSAEETLAEAKEALDISAAELKTKREEFNNKIELARQEIEAGKVRISEGEKQLADAKLQLKEKILKEITAAGLTEEILGGKDIPDAADVQKLVGLAESYKGILSMNLNRLETSIKTMEEEFALSGTDPMQSKEYLELKSKHDELLKNSSLLEAFLTTGKTQLLSAIETINSKEQELASAKDKLEQSEVALEAETGVALKQFEEAESKLSAAEEEYESGVLQLNQKRAEAEKELDAAQNELDLKKAEAESEFEKAEAEFLKVQSDLNAVPEPLWYYHTRDMNAGYAAYEDNVGRLTAVGKVFPVFFLLVAVLVCVTTMSRLVEEQRGDIGAFTTLGYKKRQIIGKYIAYSMSATIVGAAVGIVAGLMVLPTVIFNAYRMLYSSLPDLILQLDVKSAVIATLVAILCTSSVSYFTCNALLKKEPATLLRPKAPKPGKRILLERVKFVWKRLGFFSKVTVRNIFRYKARFFMTVIGVAGCTALIVAAMGLQRSINDVVNIQFGEIFTNDAVIALDESVKDDGTLYEKIMSDERFETVSLCRQNLASVMTGYGYFTDDTYIVVPENVESFTEIVNLRERKSGDKIEFSENGIILSEKLAKKLKASVGDEVRIIDKDIKKPFIVDGICENYMYGYAFMSADVYRENFGIEPEYNVYMCKNSSEVSFSEEELSKEYLETEGVLGISFIGTSIASFEDMIGSLNYVVLVMVVCAAALAFVVLYNLTNINVAERKREISTLKVLGFKNSETSAYIYRENILLTIVGIAVGLVLGIVLLNFVIATVEIDMVMFGRKLYASTFIIAAVLTALFAAIVNIVMHFRIKKIDMVESLKSIE